MAGYRRMRDTVDDLKRGGRLVVFNEPVDARLEIAEIQRRLYLNQAPAVLFTNVKGWCAARSS